ncbi:MAG: hypothetical protein M1823_001223 [Watsoniomyces obsoletus]|nr:MAG: hypothetical protein M1823_001223 [Watsoniomyces obsoletus]
MNTYKAIPKLARTLSFRPPVPYRYQCSVTTRPFQISASPSTSHNRIFNSIRHQDEFDSLLLLSASTNRPLITLWTASWCPSCRVVSPLVKGMIENDGVEGKDGGVSFAEVEIDSPTIGDLPMRYMVGVLFLRLQEQKLMRHVQINSIPMLLAFSRQEAQLETRITSVNDLKNREFLRRWIDIEAARGGAGGAGGSMFGFGKH